jgi:hypothetical protein
MTDRKAAKPAHAMEAARAAQRAFNDAIQNAKQLKTKSRDAKRRVKAAKKTAKQASKVARAARKAAEKARRVYKKALARAAKERKKAAKARKGEEAIVTPKRTSPSRNHPRPARQRDVSSSRARRRTWEIGEGEDSGGAMQTSAPAS